MDKLRENAKLNTAVKLISIAVIVAAGVIGIVCYKSDVGTLCVLAAFMIFYVMLPGRLITEYLDDGAGRLSTVLVRSFFMGFVLNVLVYFITDAIHTEILMLCVGPVLSIIWIVKSVRGRTAGSRRSMREIAASVPASFCVFAALVFLYSIAATQYRYISPEFSAYSFIKIDFSYHAGIMNALALDYPPMDPWVSGMTIQYHFFTEMLLSIPVRLFGLASEEVILAGTPYIITPVFCTALYSFFREFAGRSERAGIYCLIMHLSNMFILKQFAASWLMYHIYSNINNAGMGLACMLTTLPLLKAWDIMPGGKSSGWRGMVMLGLLMMLMTGIKGPIAIVVAGGIIGTMLLGAILRKISLRTVAVAAVTTVAFVLIYVFILGAEHSNTKGGSVFNPGEMTDVFFLKSEIMDALGGTSRAAALLVLMGVFTIFYLTAFIVPFVCGYLRELWLVLTGKKDFIFSRVTIYACVVVGFVGMMLLDFNGHSQVYFGFTAAVLIPMISYWYLEDLEGDRSKWAGFVRTAFAVCFCLSACTSVIYMYRTMDSATDFYAGHDKNSNKYRNVSAEEYDGLIWLRDNTDEDALIASDRYYSVKPEEYNVASRGSNTHFAYAVYSQRRQYIEGSGFSIGAGGTDQLEKLLDINEQLYDPDNEERGDLARELDVDYVIVSKRFDDVGDLSNKDYKLCYSNDDMDIYEIRDAG